MDHEIIRVLAGDGPMPIGDMAARLKVMAPTIRSRIKALEESGKLKVPGLIDTYQRQELITALIGLHIRFHGKLDQMY
jgi:DNA-binding Lrp family transcriptional regulator